MMAIYNVDLYLLSMNMNVYLPLMSLSSFAMVGGEMFPYDHECPYLDLQVGVYKIIQAVDII